MPQIPRAAARVLRQRDPLKLSIQSTSFVERVLNDALEAALPPRTGKTWVKGLPFGRKLDIVIALDIMPPAAGKGFKALWDLRNEYAHDPSPPLLTDERAAVIVDAWAELFPSIRDPIPDADQEQREEPDANALLRALAQAPAPVVMLKRACTAAVLVAQLAREQAPQVLADRQGGQQNRIFRQFIAERQQEALEVAAQPEEPAEA